MKVANASLVAALGCFLAVSWSARPAAAQVTTLFDFAGSSVNPGAGLVEIAPGQFFGVGFTTAQTTSNLVIYGLSLSGNFKILFTSPAISGCASTSVPPVQASDGLIYGSYTVTPCGGGSPTSQFFKYNRSTLQLTIYSIADAYPAGPPVEAVSGAFYGSLKAGLSTPPSLYTLGKNGTLKRVVNFSSYSYGSPSDTVVQVADGSLWGSTDPTGKQNGVLYKYLNSTFTTPLLLDGQWAGYLPSGLVAGPDNKLYGTTVGGAYPTGTVFSFDPASDGDTYAQLYSFPTPYSQPGLSGGTPLLYLPTGTLAGLVSAGTGSYALFQLNPHVGTIRYDSVPVKNAQTAPVGYLFQSVLGTVVGLTTDGTTGQAFQISGTPPPPFVVGLTLTSGAVGSTFTVRGNYLLQCQSVTINGSAASFTVKSSTAINVTVPAGAKSGSVVVTTLNGTAIAPTPFTVTP